MTTVRPYDSQSDYEMVRSWFEDHGFAPLPAEILNALGIITEHNGEPAAAVWLYSDPSAPVGVMEWMVTNPKNTSKLSAISLIHAIQACRAAAAESGISIILTSCRQESLARLLEKVGFFETDRDMIHMISIVTPSNPQ